MEIRAPARVTMALAIARASNPRTSATKRASTSTTWDEPFKNRRIETRTVSNQHIIAAPHDSLYAHIARASSHRTILYVKNRDTSWKKVKQKKSQHQQQRRTLPIYSLSVSVRSFVRTSRAIRIERTQSNAIYSRALQRQRSVVTAENARAKHGSLHSANHRVYDLVLSRVTMSEKLEIRC